MNTITINQSSLAEIGTLSVGNHDSIEQGMCVIEAVSYVAGEQWSDHPACVCPVIAAFLRSWNDCLPTDADRDRLLKPLIPALVGTRGSKALEERRALMAADWLVRRHTPAWLRLAGLTQQADALAGLPEITSMAQVPSLRPTIEAVRGDAAAAWDAARAAARAAARDAAWDAAGDAARDAAWAAARDAAWDAAGDAARDAAWAAARDAAWDAAWAAARDAAWAAARDAAWDAAGAALAKTTAELQQSALDLVRRMIEAKD